MLLVDVFVVPIGSLELVIAKYFTGVLLNQRVDFVLKFAIVVLRCST